MDLLKILEFKLNICLNSKLLEDGTLVEERKVVGRLEGFELRIYPNEHPPPHFHIVNSEFDASYKIEDCSKLNGSKLKKNMLKKLKVFHRENKESLIKVWDEMRTSDCSVGEYRIK
jgi:hypothetical protein